MLFRCLTPEGRGTEETYMPKVFAFVASLVLASLGGASPASAQQPIRFAQSGRPLILGAYFNCTSRGGLPSPSGTAYNGTITTRVTTGNRCGNPYQPVVQMIYTSRPGFRGQDEAYLYGPLNRRTTIIVR
jgi:hypothetical protein